MDRTNEMRHRDGYERNKWNKTRVPGGIVSSLHERPLKLSRTELTKQRMRVVHSQTRSSGVYLIPPPHGRAIYFVLLTLKSNKNKITIKSNILPMSNLEVYQSPTSIFCWAVCLYYAGKIIPAKCMQSAHRNWGKSSVTKSLFLINVRKQRHHSY